MVIATGNAGKYREIADLLEGTAHRIFSLKDFPSLEAPEETGTTFEENAVLKAEYYAKCLGVPCVADDSGLVVDALGGTPGVYSARYAGENATDAENNAKLLYSLRDVSDAGRTARFVCCAAWVGHSGALITEIGLVEGHIAHVESGPNGFGYDPLFIPLGYRETFGVLDSSVKQTISHRASAFRALRVRLLSPT
ncbi:MAG: non-canonical purine NTP pyrophosphatase [Candidatus Hydrogenedentota bacterium]